MVHALSPTSHTSAADVPEAIAGIRHGVGGDPSSLAERSLQARVPGAGCLIRSLVPEFGVRRRQLLGPHRHNGMLHTVICQALLASVVQ